VIDVSAGNSASADRAPWGPQAEHITRTYHNYLVSAANRIIEPATAAIALMVGSLAHANGLPAENVAGAELRAINITGNYLLRKNVCCWVRARHRADFTPCLLMMTQSDHGNEERVLLSPHRNAGAVAGDADGILEAQERADHKTSAGG
jgi:hypothetical protein